MEDEFTAIPASKTYILSVSGLSDTAVRVDADLIPLY